jgi:hypothetical protein
MILIWGRFGPSFTFPGIADIRVKGLHVRDRCFTLKRNIADAVFTYHAVEEGRAKIEK